MTTDKIMIILAIVACAMVTLTYWRKVLLFVLSALIAVFLYGLFSLVDLIR